MTKVVWKKGVRLKIAVFVILAFLAFAVYGFCLIQRALKFEREHLAIRNLYQIHLAQKQFKSIQDRYGTLSELAEAGLLESRLAGDQKALRFNYWISDLSSTTFCAHADRKTSDAGYTDFNISEDGVLNYRESEDIGSLSRGQRVTAQP